MNAQFRIACTQLRLLEFAAENVTTVNSHIGYTEMDKDLLMKTIPVKYADAK